MRVDDELIGRRDELAQLSGFLDNVASRSGALVIEGEAGIGKTTLWQEGLRGAKARSLRSLSCSPSGAEVQLSFTALGDLLSGVLVDTLPKIPAPQRRALEGALLLAEVEGPPPDQRAVALAVLAVFRVLAMAGPVLVAIDDAQWLDAPSADVLQFALRRLDADPVGLLATVRVPDEKRAPLSFDRMLPLERLRLGPLSLGAIHELLARRLGASLPRPALVRVHETSGGNPFFALELGRALQDQGGRLSMDQPLPVPTGLGELVAIRLAPLPARARDTLLIMAGLAQPTIELVQADARPPNGRRSISNAHAGPGWPSKTRDGSASRTRFSARFCTARRHRSADASCTAASLRCSRSPRSRRATSRWLRRAPTLQWPTP